LEIRGGVLIAIKNTALIFLPYPPSANRLWRSGRGRVYRSAEYNSWLKEAGFSILAQNPPKIAGHYKIFIEAARPDKRRRDLDNIAKASMDVLVSLGVIQDDSFAQEIGIRWVETGDGLRVLIEGVAA
jgi:crossover junction endodeoxyribonuclease RusA